MFRKMAWLYMAVLILAGTVAGAQAPKAPAASRAAATVKKASIPRSEVELKNVAPDSTDRFLAPDQFPTNVVKILRTTNKAQTNTYVPVVFDFKNNNPFNVIRFLRRPVQLEGGELFTFINDKGTGGKVLFVVPDYMVPSLKDLVATIDRPELTTSAGDKYTYVQLKHRRADISDPDFLAAAVSFSTRDGQTFLVDPEENALFLKDAPSGGTTFEAALANWLDKPTAMLDLTVKVYEVDATNDAQIGLDYMAWKNGPGASLFAVGAYAEHGSFGRQERVVYDPIGTGARGLPHNNFTAEGYNYAFRYDVPSAFFDFLAVKGKARILNQSRLSALNTRTATLTAGEQILYYAVSASDPSGVRDSGKPFQANSGRTVVGTDNKFVKVTDPVSGVQTKVLKPVQTGLTLTVTPTLGEQTIKMNLTLNWSDYNFVDDTGIPQINSRNLSSTLRGKIGEEIIIGGLNRQTVLKSTKKVPILGSIPIIGYAFGGETAQTRKSELIVVITPAAVMNYNLARTAAEKDYLVKPGDQQVIDQANGSKKIIEPNAEWGFDQAGLDKEYGVTTK